MSDQVVPKIGKKKAHRLAVEAGIEKPFRQPGGQILHCKVCSGTTSTDDAVQHAKDCWGIDYPDVKSIPNTPPPEAFIYYYKNHPEKKPRQVIF